MWSIYTVVLTRPLFVKEKKQRFNLSNMSDFHMTDSQSMAVPAFASHELISFWVDVTLLPRYLNLFSSFRDLLFIVMLPLWLKRCFVYIDMGVNATSSPFQTMQQGFSLDEYIWQKRHVFSVVLVGNCSCGVFSVFAIFLHWIYRRSKHVV